MTDTVTDTLTDVISGRTTHVIATEINMIKYQAERIYLAAAVEIGRRLTEAKALLKYGEWGKWLEESVDFSQSRANKLMRIFQEYGSEQLTSSNSDPDPNLNVLTKGREAILHFRIDERSGYNCNKKGEMINYVCKEGGISVEENNDHTEKAIHDKHISRKESLPHGKSINILWVKVW